jgi:hypothetical protein
MGMLLCIFSSPPPVRTYLDIDTRGLLLPTEGSEDLISPFQLPKQPPGTRWQRPKRHKATDISYQGQFARSIQDAAAPINLCRIPDADLKAKLLAFVARTRFCSRDG